jgi:hypothetical protein
LCQRREKDEWRRGNSAADDDVGLPKGGSDILLLSRDWPVAHDRLILRNEPRLYLLTVVDEEIELPSGPCFSIGLPVCGEKHG